MSMGVYTKVKQDLWEHQMPSRVRDRRPGPLLCRRVIEAQQGSKAGAALLLPQQIHFNNLYTWNHLNGWSCRFWMFLHDAAQAYIQRFLMQLNLRMMRAEMSLFRRCSRWITMAKHRCWLRQWYSKVQSCKSTFLEHSRCQVQSSGTRPACVALSACLSAQSILLSSSYATERHQLFF